METSGKERRRSSGSGSEFILEDVKRGRDGGTGDAFLMVKGSEAVA